MAAEIDKKIIGRVERVSFPELRFEAVHARVDTGAKTSSLWASSAIERDDRLYVVFFAENSLHYTGQPVIFENYEKTVVASSIGVPQERFKVKLLVRIGGKRIRAQFTLADRSTQVYPVLIGRNVLHGKFIVDVKKGKILKEEEQARTARLRDTLSRKAEEE